MSHKYAWSELPTEKLNPLLSRRMINAGKITVAQLAMKKGALVPRHAHPNEQTSCVTAGRLQFWLGPNAELGEESPATVVAAGEVLAIPANMPHRVRAMEDSVAMDIFTPPREDWLSGKDDYLRGGASIPRT
jgi:quercetin dioxygenase-like cupin family protein